MVERVVRRRRSMPALRTGVIRAAGVALLLTLSACSSADAPTATPLASTGSGHTTSSGAPSAGSAGSGAPSQASSGAVDDSGTVTGRAGTYSVVPPDGWIEATGRAGGASGVDLVLLSPEQIDGFSTNLVVHVAPGDEALMRTELAKGRDALASEGRTTSDAPPLTIHGLVAEGFTTTFNQSGIDVRLATCGRAPTGDIGVTEPSGIRHS